MAARWCSAALLTLCFPGMVAILDLSPWENKTYGQLHRGGTDMFSLPALPFEYSDLEPVIDQATLRVHHTGHHASYTNKMNGILEEWRGMASYYCPCRGMICRCLLDNLSYKGDGSESRLARSSLLTIMRNIGKVPSSLRQPFIDNAGGYINHNLYWAIMCRPEPGTANAPTDELLDRITRSFGSFDGFKAKFTTAALGVFGSGYAWLVEDEQGVLRITGLSNQECPLSKRLYPLLVLDVWEHAYYLKHQNKRAAYVEGWWKVVCWREVEALSKYWQALRHGKVGHTEL